MSGLKHTAIVLGITGGIACGKSEVGRILGDMGFIICDADQVAHALMAAGTGTHQRIVEAFGEQVLADDGEISRGVLGRIVFENPDQLSLLNRLVHPAVRQVMDQWISARKQAGDHAAAQVPLLFESGMGDLDWDGIICVSSPEAHVLERLGQRGINERDARVRIASQLPLKEKENLSDRVIHNTGTLQELEKATRMAVESLIAER